MQKTKLLIVIAILLLATLACNALASPTSTPIPITIVEIVSTPTVGIIPLTEADVPRISAEQAKAAMESGAAIIVDVRDKALYDVEHIAGSISISLTDMEANPTGLNLDKDQWIITYCT